MELSHSTEGDWNQDVGESTEGKCSHNTTGHIFGRFLSLIGQSIYDIKANKGKEDQHRSCEGTLEATLIL